MHVSSRVAVTVLIAALVTGGAFLASYDYQYVSSHIDEMILADSSMLIRENRVGEARLMILDRYRHAQPTEHILIEPVSLNFILGAGVWTTTAGVDWTERDWKLYKDVGFEYEQIWTTWRLIQPEPSRYDFSSVQGQIDYVRSHNPNARFFARLQGIAPDPLVAQSLSDASPPDFVGFSSSFPSNRSEYLHNVKAYVQALVSKYKNDIKLWITPIEINRIDYAVSAFNLTKYPWTVQDVVEIDRTIANAIRESDPKAVVALGTSLPLSLFELPNAARADPIEFERLAIEAGAPFDVVAIEAYGFSGDVLYWAQYLRAVSELGRPIFINEAGFSSRRIDHSATTSGDHEQATWYRNMLALSLSMKSLAGFWILDFKDRELPGRFSEFEGMGLLDSTGEPKESYDALAKFLWDLTRPNGTVSSAKGELAVRVLGGIYRITAFNATGEIQVAENETAFYTIQATGGPDLQITAVQPWSEQASSNGCNESSVVAVMEHTKINSPLDPDLTWRTSLR